MALFGRRQVKALLPGRHGMGAKAMPRVLFLADQFSDVTRSRHEKHPGGAELTDAAALQACPWPVTTRRFKDLSPGESSTYDIIVVANSHAATRQQLAEIAGTSRHVAFEHDLRVCRWRGNFPKSIDPAHRRSHRCWCPHPESRDFFGSARVIFLTALQERIFRKFYRVESNAGSGPQGCGLGLAIVDHIMRAHRGFVRVDSDLGRGTTFTLHFPLDAAGEHSGEEDSRDRGRAADVARSA